MVISMKNDIRDAARARYNELGIDKYAEVYEGDIEVLYMLLNRRLKEWTKEPNCPSPTMHLSKKIAVSKRTNGMIRKAFLFVNSFHYTQREAISFNQDGFIGFAGWASDDNVKPMCEAFEEWCDYMGRGRTSKSEQRAEVRARLVALGKWPTMGGIMKALTGGGAWGDDTVLATLLDLLGEDGLPGDDCRA